MHSYAYTNVTNYNLNILHGQIKQSALGPKFNGITTTNIPNKLYIDFNEHLTEEEEPILDDLIFIHQTTLNSNFNYQLEMSRYNQEAAIEFGTSLLKDWVRKNTLEGMSVTQSLWVFSRFEEFTINHPDFGVKTVDMFKMFNAGALPTLYYCLLRIQPDDMTEPYHWITQDRINWVKSRVAGAIGAGMVSYLESLP